MKIDLSKLQSYAQDIVDKHKTPAISMAVYYGGNSYQASAGLLNMDTAVEATSQSIFQIGSITKVMTAELLMQAVEEQRLDIDKPINCYLRDFSIKSSEASKAITARHLLNHTSGMAGDFFAEDHYGGDDLITRYVDRCRLLPQIAPVGEKFSYCNSGYVVAGRLAEVIFGGSWSELIQQRVFSTRGIKSAVANPVETMRYRVAMGHDFSKEATSGWSTVDDCYYPLGMAPIGSTLSMTASELLKFGLSYLRGFNRNGNGSGKENAPLTYDAMAQMVTSEFSLPIASPMYITDWGLGWAIIDNPEVFMFGHDGSTLGQSAMLRIVPEYDLVFTVLLNSENFYLLRDIFCDIVESVTDISFTNKLDKNAERSSDLEKYVGVYDSLAGRYEVFVEGERLYATVTQNINKSGVKRVELVPIGDHIFSMVSENDRPEFNISFIVSDSGVSSYCMSFYRLYKRR